MSERPVLPDFVFPATGNQRFQLSACKGRPPVLYPSPKDRTLGRTAEGERFRDPHAHGVRSAGP